MKILNTSPVSLSLIFLLFSLGACAPSGKALKPVAEQNQKNLSALSTNIQTLVHLYEPLLKASGTVLLYQQMGQTQQQMIAVLGSPIFVLDEAKTWHELFEESARKNQKYQSLYQLSKQAMQEGSTRMEAIKKQAGWIYTAATDADFTPQKAHTLLKQLHEIRRNSTNNLTRGYDEISQILTPIDPKLEYYYQVISDSLVLYKGLKNELEQQLKTASTHIGAISDYAEVKTSGEAVLTEFGKEEFTNNLLNLAEQYLVKHGPEIRNAILDFLTGKQP